MIMYLNFNKYPMHYIISMKHLYTSLFTSKTFYLPHYQDYFFQLVHNNEPV